ncbi:MAG: hypothetical protein EAY81_02765 [Bacteroidetes bacterium]|nr:MAG: hypothetical protein EAY81_02765 [Bacteroidota bacterium]
MDKELTVNLELLKDDIEFYQGMLKEVSADILNEGFSKYPVFIAHQEPIKLGEMIIDASEYSRSYNISATVLEELLERNIVTKEREQSFKDAYKNPSQFLCILLVTDKGASFVFVPIKKEKQHAE